MRNFMRMYFIAERFDDRRFVFDRNWRIGQNRGVLDRTVRVD